MQENSPAMNSSSHPSFVRPVRRSTSFTIQPISEDGPSPAPTADTIHEQDEEQKSDLFAAAVFAAMQSSTQVQGQMQSGMTRTGSSMGISTLGQFVQPGVMGSSSTNIAGLAGGNGSSASSNGSRYRPVRRLSVSFHSSRDLQAAAGNGEAAEDPQAELDLIELQELLQRLLDEQDDYVDVKRNVEASVQKALHTLVDDPETNMHILRLRLEPELQSLSDMILREIQSYQSIKSKNQFTLAKIRNAISFIRTEPSIKTKVTVKKDDQDEEEILSQTQMMSDSVSKKALAERIQKLELQLEVMTGLREREVREKQKTLTTNAQLANEIDRLKVSLDAETKTSQGLKMQIEELRETCRVLKKRVKEEMRSRSKEALSVSDTENITRSTSHHELTFGRLPSVSPLIEGVGRSATMSEKLAQIPAKPKAHSETVSPLISQGPKAPKFSMPTKPLTPSMVSKKGPEYTRHHPIKTSNTYHSISEISQGKSDNGTPLSQPLSARGSLLKHHGFIRPSPQWSNSFHIFARPPSYTIMTSPNQWLLQLTTGLPDLTDNLRDLSIKLSSGPEQLIQQKYLSWIHTIDTVMHSFLKVWQIVKREVNDSVSQLIWVFYDMSMFYLEVGNYDSSYAILKKAENILTHYCGELAEDLKYLICNAMAYELYLKERFSNALLLLQKAYRMIQDKNPSKLFDIHNRMGSVLIHMRNHSEALHHLMIARQYSELMKDENFKPKHPNDDHHTRTNAMGRLEDVPTKVESIAVMIYNTAIAHFHSKDYTSSQKQLDNLHKTLVSPFL
eukprot:TRINITY_DN2774_c0_g1_i4.p1 TRINITY_DN2774_c0_g1~~TRINITY_DN2774_c0_g1_i4.p1  ORF type:complete len:788 (-),score=153.86 TRINITY_DN2774_c0_g1_i4:733-3096(-)